MIGGFPEAVACKIGLHCKQHTYIDVADLSDRARLEPRHLVLLADAGALKGLAGHRHRARWQASGVEKPLPLFDGLLSTQELSPVLPAQAGQGAYSARSS